MQREDFQLHAGELVLVGAPGERVLAIGETHDLVLAVVPVAPLREGLSMLTDQPQCLLPLGPAHATMCYCLLRLLRLEDLHRVREGENTGRCILDISTVLCPGYRGKPRCQVIETRADEGQCRPPSITRTVKVL